MMINLQHEFKELIGKRKDYVIIRHLTNKKCPCTFKRGKCILPDPRCPNCEGAGWVYKEFLTRCKSFYTPRTIAHAQDSLFGVTYKNLLVVYLEATDLLDSIYLNDFLFQVAQDIDGNIIDPIKRTRKWIINDVYDMRMDDSQLEFIKIFAKPVIV